MTSTASRFFPGWMVVGGAFGVTFVGFGAAYTFSAFLQPLQDAFDASRGGLGAIFGLAGFLYFALGSISGPLADRIGVRPLAVTGMALLSIGFLLASTARSLTELFLAYGLGVGLGVGCAYVPAVAAVQRWFFARRGLASGLAVSGIGVGTLTMPPLAVALIEGLGWRQAYLVLGVGIGLVGIGSALLLESDPRQRGYRPYGEALSDASCQARSIGLKQAVRSPLFFRLYVGCLAAAFAVFVPFVHLAPYAIDHGATEASAGLLVALIGAGSTAGRFVLGSFADHIGRQRFLVATYLGMALAMAVWAVAANFAMLTVFALFYGLFYGAWVAVLPSVVMDGFGSANVSGITGILYSSVAIGTLVGPTAAGYAYDMTGSYVPPIVGGLIANIVAAAATIPRRSAFTEPPS